MSPRPNALRTPLAFPALCAQLLTDACQHANARTPVAVQRLPGQQESA
jgi:hypothetical protein